MWAGDYYLVKDSEGNFHGEFLSSIGANEYVEKLQKNPELIFTIHHSRESYEDSFRGRLSIVEEVGNLSLIEE